MSVATSADNWIIDLTIAISIVAAFISFAAAYFSFLQFKKAARQFSVDAFIRINEINRDLIKLGFHDPRFFDILDGVSVDDKRLESRYLQLWLNQAAITFAAYEGGLLTHAHWNAIKADIYSFFSDVSAMREQWRASRRFYSDSFQHELNILFETAVHTQHETIRTQSETIQACRWTGVPCQLVSLDNIRDGR